MTLYSAGVINDVKTLMDVVSMTGKAPKTVIPSYLADVTLTTIHNLPDESISQAIQLYSNKYNVSISFKRVVDNIELTFTKLGSTIAVVTTGPKLFDV